MQKYLRLQYQYNYQYNSNAPKGSTWLQYYQYKYIVMLN